MLRRSENELEEMCNEVVVGQFEVFPRYLIMEIVNSTNNLSEVKLTSVMRFETDTSEIRIKPSIPASVHCTDH
jgi:hypothetical protein